MRATQQIQGQHRQLRDTLPQTEKGKKDRGCSSVVERLPSVCWALPELNLQQPTPTFKKKRHKKERSTTTTASEICGTLSQSLPCEIKLPKEGPERKGSVGEGAYTRPDINPRDPHSGRREGCSQVVL